MNIKNMQLFKKNIDNKKDMRYVIAGVMGSIIIATTGFSLGSCSRNDDKKDDVSSLPSSSTSQENTSSQESSQEVSSNAVSSSMPEVAKEQEEIKMPELMTEGELLYNTEYLTEINNLIHKSLAPEVKPLYKESPVNEEIIKNALLVLNGFKPLNEEYFVNEDLTYALSTLFGMEKIQVAMTKNNKYIIDKTKLLSASSEGNKIIAFLDEHVKQIMLGNFSNFKHFENEVSLLVKGFEGVYPYNYVPNEQGVCEPVENNNYKKENKVTLVDHNEICGKSMEIDLSKLTDGEIHAIALVMQAGINSYYTSVNVSEEVFMEKVMLVYPVLNNSAFYIQENLSNYLNYDMMSKEDDGKRLLDVLRNQYEEIINWTASSREKQAYLENIFVVNKKLYGSLDEVFTIDENGECKVEENTRKCEPDNVIALYNDATTPVKVKVGDKLYISLSEKIQVLEIMMDSLNTNAFNGMSIVSKAKDGTDVVITSEQLSKSLQTVLNSLYMERNKQIAFENEKTLDKTFTKK